MDYDISLSQLPWVINVAEDIRIIVPLTTPKLADLLFEIGSERKVRHRPEGVFGKGVSNSKNASEMRQSVSLFYWGKEERSKMRQKCVKLASDAQSTFGGRTPFGRYRKFKVLSKETGLSLLNTRLEFAA